MPYDIGTSTKKIYRTARQTSEKITQKTKGLDGETWRGLYVGAHGTEQRDQKKVRYDIYKHTTKLIKTNKNTKIMKPINSMRKIG